MHNTEYTPEQIDTLIAAIKNDGDISDTIKTRRIEMLEAMKEPDGQSQAELEDSVKRWVQETATGYHHINTTHPDNRQPANTQAYTDIKKWAKARN